MALIYCNNAWRVVPTICERIFYIWSRPTEQHCALINSHRTSYLEKKKAHWLGIQIDGTQFFAACSSLWIQQRIPGEFILASAWWKISSHNRSSTVGELLTLELNYSGQFSMFMATGAFRTEKSPLLLRLGSQETKGIFIKTMCKIFLKYLILCFLLTIILLVKVSNSSLSESKFFSSRI